MGILWILPDSFMHVGLSCLVSPAGGYLHIHSSYSGSVSRAQLRVGSGGRRVRVSSASRALLLQWDSQKQEWENTTKQKNRIIVRFLALSSVLETHSLRLTVGSHPIRSQFLRHNWVFPRTGHELNWAFLGEF